MREQIDIKTWIWYVTPQCHLKLRIKPTPHPVNFAKIPYERMDWHKDLKFGMWHQKNIFSLSFQKWSLWGVPKKNLEKCSISYSKIVILGCKDYEKLTLFINFLDWHKIILNHAEVKKEKNLKYFNFIFKIVIFDIKTWLKSCTIMQKGNKRKIFQIFNSLY